MCEYLAHSNGLVVSWVCLTAPILNSSKLTIGSVQLLHRLSIRGVNGPEKLLKVIKVVYSSSLACQRVKYQPSESDY
jgi:hypothetical protein